VKELNFCRHPGENRGPVSLERHEKHLIPAGAYPVLDTGPERHEEEPNQSFHAFLHWEKRKARDPGYCLKKLKKCSPSEHKKHIFCSDGRTEKEEVLKFWQYSISHLPPQDCQNSNDIPISYFLVL